ncbi:MAG: class I SAM-dependent methyltransferase [Gammaproteobacteria bacterium]|nr:class I SAM-dependent methyltransferase [Gammaproteobacteria bacterium]
MREDAVSAALREKTQSLPQRGMLSPPEQVQLLTVLAKLIGAKRLLEVGTFTGYTALRLALALPDDARITCCDVNGEWTSIGAEHWRRAGVAEKITLRLGPALATLEELLTLDGEGSFDFAYIDADKTNYLNYYECCLRLLRSGGLLAVDNVMWGGSVIDRQVNDADTRAIRVFNTAVRADRRVLPVMVPVGDGLTLAYKH